MLISIRHFAQFYSILLSKALTICISTNYIYLYSKLTALAIKNTRAETRRTRTIFVVHSKIAYKVTICSSLEHGTFQRLMNIDTDADFSPENTVVNEKRSLMCMEFWAVSLSDTSIFDSSYLNIERDLTRRCA